MHPNKFTQPSKFTLHFIFQLTQALFNGFYRVLALFNLTLSLKTHLLRSKLSLNSGWPPQVELIITSFKSCESLILIQFESVALITIFFHY